MSYRVVGDWGTSRLRLFRIEDGACVAQASGLGIGVVDGQAEAAFAQAVAPWLDDGAPDSITLCGMAGARDGWVEAPYADCPADAPQWSARSVRFDWRGVPVSILAGLACSGTDGAPDVMRGEETQMFGACALDPILAQGRRLFVLPGTHNKWALVDNGRVAAFRTMPTGELFALLADRSTLGAPAGDDPAAQDAGFAEGLEKGGEGRPLTALFAARSMRLRAGRSADWARGYLSGLLIAAEVAEVRDFLGDAAGMVMIGDSGLADRYAQALGRYGAQPRRMDGDACALAGLVLAEGLTA